MTIESFKEGGMPAGRCLPTGTRRGGQGERASLPALAEILAGCRRRLLSR